LDMSGGRIALLVFGIIFLLVSVGLLTFGGGLMFAHYGIRDSQGYYTTDTVNLQRDSYALVTVPADIDMSAGGCCGWQQNWTGLASIRVEGESTDNSREIFIGIGDEDQVKDYLSGVRYDEIREFRIYPYEVEYKRYPGTGVPELPLDQVWVASVHGPGTQTLEWDVEPGQWVLVVMNADASLGVDVNGTIGIKFPWLFGVALACLIAGAVLLVVGILMVVLSATGSGGGRQAPR
jgi:hypothetical protein